MMHSRAIRKELTYITHVIGIFLMQKLPFMFISFSLFAKQRERNEPKKEKTRKRSLHFANAQCQNII